MSIYTHNDYKKYTLEQLHHLKDLKKGIRSRLAEHLNCHSAYISKVLNGSFHFSMEQGERLADFFDLDQNESYFLLLLIEYARAGSKPLQKILQSKIDKLSAESLNIKSKIKDSDILNTDIQRKYYSQWMYLSVHALCSVESEKINREYIANYLRLPVKKVHEIIEFLKSHGLIIETPQQGFKVGNYRINLTSESSSIYNHLSNWRTKALERMLVSNDFSLHYSSLICIPKQDAMKIKDNFLHAIENARKITQESRSKDLFAYNIDFFSLKY